MNKKSVTKSPRILQIRQDRGYDCVYAGGKKFMLGKSGSPEAQAAFLKLQIQALTDPALSSRHPQDILIDNLCFAYLGYS